MENDRLKDIFDNYEPELTSDSSFMNRIILNLDSADSIRRDYFETKAQNRKAVIIAACVGFVTGVLFSFAVPYLRRAISAIYFSMPVDISSGTADFNITTAAWLITGGMAVFTTLNAYEISISLMTVKKRH